jgi:hypothetical protein
VVHLGAWFPIIVLQPGWQMIKPARMAAAEAGIRRPAVREPGYRKPGFAARPQSPAQIAAEIRQAPARAEIPTIF